MTGVEKEVKQEHRQFTCFWCGLKVDYGYLVSIPDYQGPPVCLDCVETALEEGSERM